MAASKELACVLDFVFAANIDSTEAFATAKALMEAGVRSREDIAALTPEKAKALTDKKVHRKLLNALRKMPTLDSPESQPVAKAARRAAEPPPPPPKPDDSMPDIVLNRSPVMICWAAACAHAMGYDWETSLSLGSACAAVFARAKGKSLGLYDRSTSSSASTSSSSSSTVPIWLLGKLVPAEVRASEGDNVRGLSENQHRKGCMDVVHPSAVHRSLSSAFGVDKFGAAWHGMLRLACSVPSNEFASAGNQIAYDLYCKFRPDIPQGLAGWGQPGRLRMSKVAELVRTVPTQERSLPLKTVPPGSMAQSSPVPAPTVSASTAPASSIPACCTSSPSPSATTPSSQATESGPDNVTAAHVFQEIERSGGITMAELSKNLEVGFETCASLVEALQEQGAVYERDGKLLPL